MRQKSTTTASPSERLVKNIRRAKLIEELAKALKLAQEAGPWQPSDEEDF